MPYPYTNSLGKTPPPGSPAARKVNPSVANKATAEQLSQIQAHVDKMTKEILAEKQKKVSDAFFASKPTTIKFPGVVPAVIQKDFPGSTKANDYGKVDLTSIPEEGPAKLYDTGKIAEWYKNLMKEGTLSKEEAYSQLYGKSPIEQDLLHIQQELNKKLKAKVLGEFPALPKPEQIFGEPPVSYKPTSYMGFTKQATGLGEQDAFEVHMKFSVEGIEGLDDKILNAKQLVSKPFIYASYGKSAQEKIIDDMLRQIKLEIMEQIKKGK